MKYNINKMLLDKLIICQIDIKVKNTAYKIPAYFDIIEVKKLENNLIEFVKVIRVFDPEKYLSKQESYTEEHTITSLPNELKFYLENEEFIKNQILRH